MTYDLFTVTHLAGSSFVLKEPSGLLISYSTQEAYKNLQRQMTPL